jgi:hypothetical protein
MADEAIVTYDNAGPHAGRLCEDAIRYRSSSYTYLFILCCFYLFYYFAYLFSFFHFLFNFAYFALCFLRVCLSLSLSALLSRYLPRVQRPGLRCLRRVPVHGPLGGYTDIAQLCDSAQIHGSLKSFVRRRARRHFLSEAKVPRTVKHFCRRNLILCPRFICVLYATAIA